jgi:hypothetical protein
MDNLLELSDDFIRLCKSITAKRPKAIIDHLLQYGFITTEEIKNIYGYNHPPRAARDVRENGIPLDTFYVMGSDGRRIAAYRFGIIDKARFFKISGRTGLSKQLKSELIKQYGCKCFIYLEKVGEHDLQIDHRIPFEIDGEADILPENFMLLCGSANRVKSWSCEHCENWNSIKDRSVCLSCYWAYPESYTHIAMQQVRRIDLMWQGEDIELYENLKQYAIELEKDIPTFIKEIIEREINRNLDG